MDDAHPGKKGTHTSKKVNGHVNRLRMEHKPFPGQNQGSEGGLAKQMP